MEQHICLECNRIYEHRKTLGRHIKDDHGFMYIDYLAKHGKSETQTCHCGKQFENTRYPGGPRAHGRRQVHCSPECNALANSCRRNYGITVEIYWEHARKGCGVCHRMVCSNGRKLFIDHDHETGKFRGALCDVCNSSRVGMNTFENIQEVVQYLQRAAQMVDDQRIALPIP